MENNFLIENLRQYYNEQELEKILCGFSAKRKTTFRINRIKSSKEEIEEELTTNKINFQNVLDLYKEKRINFYIMIKHDNQDEYEIFTNETENKYIDYIFENFYDAYVIEDDKILRETNIYKDGKIYMQSLSSMMPVFFLDMKENEDILDMCAAPGGKSTQIQSIMKNKINLTSYEKNKIRFETLKYNVEKSSSNILLKNESAENISDFFKFNKILIDAPCSGSGIIDLNKNDYKKYFTSVLIQKVVKTQKKLLDKAIKILSKSGQIIYSTCSLLDVENEIQVNKIKTKSKETIEIKVFPNEYFEGFYICSLKF